MEETALVTLKKDEVTQKKYWHICKDGWKEGVALDPDKFLHFDPNHFGEGTIIKVFEK